ncbi:hypothetical protein DL96DRAFT_636968 [Flagelloscypha sp. PMI_526]|nr:hypothetical protein DL96DRAFT_636968 [Flagelloscypha sp. PMI_526]
MVSLIMKALFFLFLNHYISHPTGTLDFPRNFCAHPASFHHGLRHRRVFPNEKHTREGVFFMAEAIAVAAVALAAPPCIRAVIEVAQDTTFWVKIIGILRLSSRARGAVISSHILRYICKVRAELKKSRAVLPADQVKDFVDKLSRKITLYNKLVTEHSVADSKKRVNGLVSVKKSLIRLLQDIKDLARKCADEKLLHDLKTCLYCDENVTYPDGTIAAYHRDGVQPQPLSATSVTETAQARTDEMNVATLPRSSSPPQSRTRPSSPSGLTSMSFSSQQLSVPINLVFTFTTSGNSSTVPDNHHSPSLQQS